MRDDWYSGLRTNSATSMYHVKGDIIPFLVKTIHALQKAQTSVMKAVNDRSSRKDRNTTRKKEKGRQPQLMRAPGKYRVAKSRKGNKRIIPMGIRKSKRTMERSTNL